METPAQFTQDPDKVIEAVIYMAEHSKADSYFGERKVYKLLYYADCEAYRQHGAPITGTMSAGSSAGSIGQSTRRVCSDAVVTVTGR